MILKAIPEFLTAGILLGLVAGISPGPLLTLVISETLKDGRKAGMRMALVPAITDIPIVIASLFMLSGLANYETIIGVISILGGLFILYLAYESIFFKDLSTVSGQKSHSMLKGIISNFLSPHPYLFWILVGGSIVLKASQVHFSLAIMFIALFYVLLIGSKIVIVLLIQRFSNLLSTSAYHITLRILGICLLAFSLYFFITGINYII